MSILLLKWESIKEIEEVKVHGILAIRGNNQREEKNKGKCKNRNDNAVFAEVGIDGHGDTVIS